MKKTLLTDAPSMSEPPALTGGLTKSQSKVSGAKKTPAEIPETVKEVIENKKENSLDRPRIVKSPADDPANKPKNKSSTDKKPKT